MTQSVRQWLEHLGMPQYAQMFEANDVDVSLLPRLTDQSLKDIGVASLGHRLRILGAIGKPSANDRASDQLPDLTGSEVKSRLRSMSSEPERRQLTVLFCDLVDSTALSERLDPEAYRELVLAYQAACAKVINQYEGHIAQYLGDGLLVYFGYPKAHEDDAQRAVGTGLAMIAAVSALTHASGPLAIRVGVHTGVVVIGEVGSGISQEQLALGDTPNIAARLQGLAKPNTVVLSERTRQVTANSFEYEDLGRHAMKGIAEPVRVWRASKESYAESRFEATSSGTVTPMMGRDLEFAVLMHAWQRAKSGKGQLVLLCGEPGIGKSRLLLALREHLIGEGTTAWQYQCSPYFTNSALYPVIDNFGRALKFERDEHGEAKMDRLERLLDEYGRPLLDANLIAQVLSLPAAERYGILSMTPQKQKEETLRALNDLITAAASRHPVVMLFEDLHWSDPTTLESLDVLLARMDRIPVLVVATYRPEFRPQWIGQPLVTALTLSRLDQEQTRAVINHVTAARALPEEVTKQIVDKTDGIPLFVEELTKSILESALLKQSEPGGDAARTLPVSAIPATLRDSLMARLDRLAPAKEVAQIGACIGREFDHALLCLVFPLPDEELQRALNILLASELVFRRGQLPDVRYIFKHALIQEAAYDSLLKTKRAHLHAQIALALEEHFPDVVASQPELIAHHLTAAELNAAAVPYWHKAGEKALSRLAVQEALNHLDRGLEVLLRSPPSADRNVAELALRSALGWAWMALHGWAHPKIGEHLSRAWQLSQALKSDHHTLRIVTGLWVNDLVAGRARQSMIWADRMLDRFQATGEPDLELMAYWQKSNSCRFLGENYDTDRYADLVLRRYEKSRHRYILDALNHDAKTSALLYKAHAQWLLGFPETSHRLLEQAVSHSRECDNAFNLCWALTESAIIHALRRDPARAWSCLNEADRLAGDQRLVFFSDVSVPLIRSWLVLLEDGYDHGANALRSALTKWASIGAYVGNTLTKTALADAAARSGQLAESVQLLNEVLEQARRPGWEEQVYLPEALRVSALVCSLQGDSQKAEKTFLEALALARTQRARSWQLRTAISYAHLMISQARRKEAIELLQPIYDWFTEGRSTEDQLEAAALLQRLR